MPARAPEGLCPKCLFRGVAAPTDSGVGQARPTPPSCQAKAAAEPAGEILPLVQFEDAPLVDVILTLARLAKLNIILDPKLTAVDQTGKSIHAPVSIRLENTTAQNVLEAVLNKIGRAHV